MRTIQHLLESKGHQIWTINLNEKVINALKILNEKDIGALVVLDGEKPVGVFSERDYARKLELKGIFAKDTLVKDVMSTVITYSYPEQTVEECMEIMTDKHIRHLPILENGKLSGMISIGDLVKSIIFEQKQKIEHLERYIRG